MGSAPRTVNSRGEVLTDDMRDYLDKISEQDGHKTKVTLGGKTGETGDWSSRAWEIFNNWMYGIQPKAVDPTRAIAEAAKTAPGMEKWAVGGGQGGLFGFGKYAGNDTSQVEEMKGLESLGNSPMAPGVPYKVPPIPKLGGK